MGVKSNINPHFVVIACLFLIDQGGKVISQNLIASLVQVGGEVRTPTFDAPNCWAPLRQHQPTKCPTYGMLLGGEKEGDMLLLNCIHFPEPAKPALQVARYMITLCDPNHCPAQQWLLFKKQFDLTPAEFRLCRSFGEGLNLNDYCEKWNVTTSTARSQLHSVFGKTSTHRQSDLLRLIFLFSRI